MSHAGEWVGALSNTSSGSKKIWLKVIAIGVGLVVVVVTVVVAVMHSGSPREQGLDGTYTVTGPLDSCSGLFTGCARKVHYHTTWTISECQGDGCLIGSPNWTATVPLTNAGGRWTAAGLRNPLVGYRCRGVPVATVDAVDVSADSVTGALRGTVQVAVSGTTCKTAKQTFTVTAVR
jgi:hypothetical protein